MKPQMESLIPLYRWRSQAQRTPRCRAELVHSRRRKQFYRRFQSAGPSYGWRPAPDAARRGANPQALIRCQKTADDEAERIVQPVPRANSSPPPQLPPRSFGPAKVGLGCTANFKFSKGGKFANEGNDTCRQIVPGPKTGLLPGFCRLQFAVW